jgi:hypothetical protein
MASNLHENHSTSTGRTGSRARSYKHLNWYWNRSPLTLGRLERRGMDAERVLDDSPVPTRDSSSLQLSIFLRYSVTAARRRAAAASSPSAISVVLAGGLSRSFASVAKKKIAPAPSALSGYVKYWPALMRLGWVYCLVYRETPLFTPAKFLISP